MVMFSQGFIPDGSITDAKVAALAAIAWSKLSKVGSNIHDLAALGIVDADVAAGAAIAKTKLAALGIVDADVAAGAAIAKTKLAALGIVDADVAAGAAINVSKLGLDIGATHKASEVHTANQPSSWPQVASKPSNLTYRGSGSYTGNSSVNRGIAHGLSVTPALVLITNQTGLLGYLIKSGLLEVNDATAAAGYYSYTVTPADGTNFYVGNAGDYNRSLNGNTIVYYWIAFG